MPEGHERVLNLSPTPISANSLPSPVKSTHRNPRHLDIANALFKPVPFEHF